MSANRLVLWMVLLAASWGCEISDTEQMTRHAPVLGISCPKSTEGLVNSSRRSLTVSYLEPMTKVDGTPLTGLEKTTIYYDLGNGAVKAMDVPATRPSGGGRIIEKIPIPIEDNQEVFAVICVTATDTNGNEGPPTP